MAVGNNNQSTFYGITNGKICRQFASPTEKSVERTNKNGKQVHEEFYDYICGRITDITVKNPPADHQDYGKQWVITLQDDDGSSVLQMNYSSGYSSVFLKILPNVDLSADVKIVPKQTVEGTKKKSSLFIMQHGEPLKHFFTKENPGDLPQLTQKKIKGKMTWDDSDMMEFLENMVKNEIVPKIKGAPSEVTSETESDDLPL
jgi:hypothetical protein